MANTIRQLREKNSYDEATVATALKISVREYKKLERGMRGINLVHLCHLSDFYQIRKSLIVDYGNKKRVDTNVAIEAALRELEVTTKWLSTIREKIAILEMRVEKKISA